MNLLDDDLDLACKLGWVERRLTDDVAQNVEAQVELLHGRHRVVDGLIKRGPSVDLAARSLDLARDLNTEFPNRRPESGIPSLSH